ncbi:MAG: ribosomal-processing cysteine protease Prp [Erysipelotrichaceae bacterium]
MIKIDVTKAQENVVALKIVGHSGSNTSGHDLVCAGVSSIGIGLLNALDIIVSNQCEMTMDEGLIEIRVIKYSNECQLILNCGIIQLQTMENEYPQYIKIKQMEV